MIVYVIGNTTSHSVYLNGDGGAIPVSWIEGHGITVCIPCARIAERDSRFSIFVDGDINCHISAGARGRRLPHIAHGPRSNPLGGRRGLIVYGLGDASIIVGQEFCVHTHIDGFTRERYVPRVPH